MKRRETGLAVLLAAMVAVTSIVNPAFLSPSNLRDLLVQAAPFAVLACGMAFVVVLGEIDISVGSMVGLLGALVGVLSSPARHGSVALALAALAAGSVVLGLFNGALTVLGRVPSIIVTLGTLTVFRGLAEVVLGGEWVTDMPDSLRWFGTGAIGGVPVPILVAVVVSVGAWLVATRTPLGLRVYAAGGNPEAAHVRGLPVRRYRLFAFVVMGVLSGVATLIAVPQLSAVESGIGVGWELFTVTCVVVGGVSITGGRGSVVGVLLGVLLLGTVRTMLLFLKLGDQAVYWERAIQGAFIIVAVLADRARRRAR